jgi:hypothetical protein
MPARAQAAPNKSPHIGKARAVLNRIARNLQLFSLVAALIGTPVLMYLAFNLFGTLSAVQFRIQDLNADYLAGIGAALLLLAATFAWPVPQHHRQALVLLWMIRCGVSLGVTLAFEAFYGLDASGYYQTGLSLSDPVSWLMFGDGTKNISGIVGMLSRLTASYSAIKVIFSYVGLIAIYILYRSAVICLGKDNLAILYALGLLPSLLFWTSILGKDPIVMLGIAIYCFGVAGIITYHRISWLTFVVIGLLIASFIRVWLGLIFATPLIATYVLAGRASALTKIMFVMVAVPGFLIAFQGFAEQFSVESTEDLISTTQRISRSWAFGGSAQEITVDFTSIESMLAFMPVGLFTALFRPLPFEVRNIFGLFAGIENAALLGLIVVGIPRRGFGWLRQPILLWAVSTLIVWGAIYGFASYQNLGTAFRFRAQVAPILLLLGLYLAFGTTLRAPRFLRANHGAAQASQPASAPARNDASSSIETGLD